MRKRKRASDRYLTKIKRAGARWAGVRSLLFLALLLVFMFIGFCFFLRPETSVIEKRKLAELPKLTLQGIWDGTYFSDLQTWYTDTYPLRELMISQGSSLEELYGLHKAEIHGNVAVKADDIPDDAKPQEAGLIELPKEAEDGASDKEAERKEPQGTGQTEDGSKEDQGTLPEDGKGQENKEAGTDVEEPEAGADGTIHEAPESAGNVYISGDRAVEIYYFSQKNADYYASMVNTVRANMPDSVDMYELLVPTAFGVCMDDAIQESLGGSSEQAAIDYIYKRLNEKVKAVPSCETLIKHNGEYIYFRTDHHWTALGAYYAYFEWCRKKGVEPHALEEYGQMEFDGFLGSYYAASNQSAKLSNPDTVTAYVPLATNKLQYTDKNGQVNEWPVINDVGDYAAGAKYSCFAAGDNPYTEITNPSLHDGSACILIKESYGNAFVPFLVDHYQTVYMIDYRYYKGNLNDLIREKNVGDLILLNNMEALSKTHVDEMLHLFM